MHCAAYAVGVVEQFAGPLVVDDALRGCGRRGAGGEGGRVERSGGGAVEPVVAEVGEIVSLPTVPNRLSFPLVPFTITISAPPHICELH